MRENDTKNRILKQDRIAYHFDDKIQYLYTYQLGREQHVRLLYSKKQKIASTPNFDIDSRKQYRHT